MSKPSNVFLELWQWRALDQSPEKFAECAAAWRQIVSLEEIYAAAQRRERMLAALEPWAKEPTGTAEKDGENVTTVAMADNSAGGASPSPTSSTEGGQTYDCASAPMTDEAEAAWTAAEAEAKAREAANRSAGAKAGVATRKRNLTERLEELRRRGVKMHEIAAAVNGLTITDVMDALEAKPMSPLKIQALEKACKKLGVAAFAAAVAKAKEADAGGGEDS